MKNIDYDYISENISEISRIPIRLYKKGELVKIYSPITLYKDPALLYLEQFLEIRKTISYYITPFYEYYGILCHNEYLLILGPTSEFPISKAQIREMMFLLGIPEQKKAIYQSQVQGIPPMPLQIFLHFLCLLYYYLSGEKKSASEIMLFDSSSNISLHELKKVEENPTYYEIEEPHTQMHSSYEFEKKLFHYISNGDPDGLLNFFSHATAGHAGKIGDTYIRQLKNIFIVTATLASRAAIDGGMPAEEALTLSDAYIRHSEKYLSPEPISNLQYNMIMDFATQIHDLNHGKNYSKAIRNSITYIRNNLTKNITIDELAEVAFLSRSQLSVRFHKETGMTITEYIRKQKILKAKELLSSTNKPQIEISNYLGFSSQSHFHKVFKEITGITPNEYRHK